MDCEADAVQELFILVRFVVVVVVDIVKTGPATLGGIPSILTEWYHAERPRQTPDLKLVR